ncbi:MAG TPA: DUF1153 domain-containing protein [Rhizomicrobium sp.]|jgi:hypothetical protein|nr:DUF1153 domain-containing protein [Rhizomicrobium sp.]
MKAVHAKASHLLGAQPLTFESLPPQNGTRWNIRRKTAVVMAVLNGILSFDDACRRYAMSAEEFLSWQDLVTRRTLANTRRPGHERRSAAAAVRTAGP